MGACACCRSALRDSLRGIAVLTALGGLAGLLFGLHSLAPLGSVALDPSVSWFALVLCGFGVVTLLLGLSAGLGLSAAIHCFTGASFVLLPLSALLVWAYSQHAKQLRWLADRDQTYALTALLDWLDGHLQLAAGLAGLWLLLQGGAVALGSVYACCPSPRRQRHPWDRYWAGEEDSREPLLPRAAATGSRGGSDGAGAAASPRAAGFHTPPSRFQSPYQSPSRYPPGPLTTGMPPPAAAMG